MNDLMTIILASKALSPIYDCSNLVAHWRITKRISSRNTLVLEMDNKTLEFIGDGIIWIHDENGIDHSFDSHGMSWKHLDKAVLTLFASSDSPYDGKRIEGAVWSGKRPLTIEGLDS